jgi:hypothetical protein
MTRDNKYITKIIAASLLGDASIETDKRDNGNHSFTINQIVDHKDYIQLLSSIIEPITSTSITLVDKSKQTHIIGVPTVCKNQLRLRTKRHPFFNSFRERMYINGRKVVDPHYLTLLDWEFLAHWYMQDGYMSAYWSKKEKKAYACYAVGLCTNNFSYPEQMFLRSKLKEKLNLDWNVVKDGRNYRLKLSAQQIPLFINGVKQYIAPSFHYKIDYSYHDKKLLSLVERIAPEKGDDIVWSVRKQNVQDIN